MEKMNHVRKEKLCYKCLAKGHDQKDCPLKETKLCNIKGCAKFHHELLHGRLGINFVEDIFYMAET